MVQRLFCLGVLAAIATVLVLTGCRDTPPRGAEAELPASMKGYELYSWRSNNAWVFKLMTGTNRNKTEAEVTSGDDALSDAGYVNVRVEGLAELTALLDRLPAETSVIWIGPEAYGIQNDRQLELGLPDAATVRDLVVRAARRGVKLIVPSSPPSP